MIDYKLFRTDGSQVDISDSSGNEYGPIGPVNEGLVPITMLRGVGFNLYGWADTSGNIVKFFEDDPDPDLPVSFVRTFNQGLSPVWVCPYDEESETDIELCGFMDRSFHWVIQPGYTMLMVRGPAGRYEVFGDTGLALMQNTAGKWGGIDKTGRTVLPFQYDGFYPYSQGLAAFKENGKWGYIDEKGQVAIPAQYVITTSFSDDGYAVAYDGSKAFLIDKSNQKIPGADQLDPSTYFVWDEDDIPRIYTPGEYVVIEKDGKYGYGHVEYLQPLPEKDEMHDWAYEEVVAAIENDLVPSYLQNLYLNDIKRGEFCDVIIQAMEAVLDKDIAQIVKDKTGEDITNYQHSYPFVDTTDTNTLAANKLDIVGGRGNGVFDPYTNITRQEAAAMLMRAAKVLGMKNDGDGNTSFADSDQVKYWAVEAVEYICKAEIMNGRGDVFDPNGSYSREQSFMTIYRLFQKVAGQ